LLRIAFMIDRTCTTFTCHPRRYRLALEPLEVGAERAIAMEATLLGEHLRRDGPRLTDRLAVEPAEVFDAQAVIPDHLAYIINNERYGQQEVNYCYLGLTMPIAFH